MNLKQIRMECIMGKSDRELLELAARAAGHTLGPDWDCLPSGIFINGDDNFSGVEWNPLTDDGDALRLADSLDFIVDFSRFSVIKAEMFYLGHRDFVLGNNVNEAITRAAAKIGKEMK